MIRVIDHIEGQRRVGWVSHGLNPSYGLKSDTQIQVLT